MSTTTYTNCMRIERVDGVVLCLTDLDKDLNINDSIIGVGSDDQVYLSSAGYTPTNVQQTSDNAVNNGDIEGLLTSVGVDRNDIIGGRYDFAKLHIFIWDFTNDVLVKKLGSGKWGESTIKDGKYVAEFRGLSQQLQQTIGRVYGPECDEQLGGPRCKMVLAIYPHTATATSVTNEFTFQDSTLTGVDYTGMYVQFTSGDNRGEHALILSSIGTEIILDSSMPNAISIGDDYKINDMTGEHYIALGTIATVTDSQNFTVTLSENSVDDYFNYGKFLFNSGNNMDLYMEVKDYTEATKTFQLFLPMPFEINVGDTFEVYAGCDKKQTTCKTKFNIIVEPTRGNLDQYQGFPDLPGLDQITKFGGQ